MSKISLPPPELFYDRLLSHYQKGYVSVQKPYPESWEDCCGLQARILEHATAFFINGAVADDLYNIPRDLQDIDCLDHLPFPVLYFELMDPLEIIVGTQYKRQVKGMVIGRERVLFPGSLSAAFGKDYFNILLYDAHTLRELPPRDLPDTAYFEADRPYDLGFNSQFFQYLPREMMKTIPIKTYTLDSHKGIMQNPLSEREEEGVRDHFSQITNFCLNLVDYINAHNITLRVVQREKRNLQELERINRKRQAKGKRAFSALKPFYWVEVKEKTIILEEKADDTAEEMKVKELDEPEGDMLQYREWVRGHFQRYHTKSGIKKNWINSYVRGPAGAPWKENRYMVLEEMLERGAFPVQK